MCNNVVFRFERHPGAQTIETIPEPLSMTKAAEKKGEKKKKKQSSGFLVGAQGGGGCRG